MTRLGRLLALSVADAGRRPPGPWRWALLALAAAASVAWCILG